MPDNVDCRLRHALLAARACVICVKGVCKISALDLDQIVNPEIFWVAIGESDTLLRNAVVPVPIAVLFNTRA